ncbi:hypothetical protein B0H65DRAFT_451730 [Neurospora tetraspora]|uniref:Uncharacterized protein n=1 Tax=Neurospora tetraspora TaxID=94610 RepID=A0AAE0MWY8_9PEZI|nr:hypothetical protein B0H65DRAFT_451730 [Neurospora tetraspora]
MRASVSAFLARSAWYCFIWASFSAELPVSSLILRSRPSILVMLLSASLLSALRSSLIFSISAFLFSMSVWSLAF